MYCFSQIKKQELSYNNSRTYETERRSGAGLLKQKEGVELMNYFLKNARIKSGLTQEELARSVNITLKSYQNIESQKVEPKVIKALKICLVLDLNPFETFIK